MNTPIVFLDVDGVLVTPSTAQQGLQAPLPGERFGYHLFDSEAVAALNHITDATGAVIVLSSTWRRLHWPSFRAIANRQGVTGTIIDRTPVLDSGRGSEIREWRAARGHDGPFVVLDDDVDDLRDLMPHVVQTTWYGPKPGLRGKHVKQALRILEGA